MKNATLTLLCCCVLLSACDNTGETDTGIDAAGYDTGSASSDTGVSGGEAGKQAAVELEQALVKANETAEKPADSAQQLVDTAVESVKDVSAAAVERSTDVSSPVSADDVTQGESIYRRGCFACHGTGVAGAPKLGDSDAWESRLAQGNAVLSQHAIEGYKGVTGYMPPKGGYSNLSDDEVRQAVDYMVSQVP